MHSYKLVSLVKTMTRAREQKRMWLVEGLTWPRYFAEQAKQEGEAEPAAAAQRQKQDGPRKAAAAKSKANTQDGVEPVKKKHAAPPKSKKPGS